MYEAQTQSTDASTRSLREIAEIPRILTGNAYLFTLTGWESRDVYTPVQSRTKQFHPYLIGLVPPIVDSCAQTPQEWRVWFGVLWGSDRGVRLGRPHLHVPLAARVPGTTMVQAGGGSGEGGVG